MGQWPAKETNVIDIAGIFRRWKWLLLFAGALILAGGVAFVLAQSNKNVALGIMLPRQISFSFTEKENYTLSAKSLNKYDFEKLALFLLNRDLFEQYEKELPGRSQTFPAKPYDLKATIIPKYALDFSNAAVRNETLQYLLFKVDPDAGWPAAVVDQFVLNITKNYYLLRIFQDYYNHLQTMHINSLDNQRNLLERSEDITLKIARLREQGKKHPGISPGRNDFMLQVTAENERYLDVRQQLAANDILLNDNQIALELNQKQIAKLRLLIRFVNELCHEYLEFLFRDPSLAKSRLLKIQAQAGDKDLDQEFQKLAALFDVLDSNFRIFSGDPTMFRDRFLLLKALALCFFAFGLLLLGVLALEHRRTVRASATRN